MFLDLSLRYLIAIKLKQNYLKKCNFLTVLCQLLLLLFAEIFLAF